MESTSYFYKYKLLYNAIISYMHFVFLSCLKYISKHVIFCYDFFTSVVGFEPGISAPLGKLKSPFYYAKWI